MTTTPLWYTTSTGDFGGEKNKTVRQVHHRLQQYVKYSIEDNCSIDNKCSIDNNCSIDYKCIDLVPHDDHIDLVPHRLSTT